MDLLFPPPGVDADERDPIREAIEDDQRRGGDGSAAVPKSVREMIARWQGEDDG